MVMPWQKPGINSSETENVIREYMEKMTLALEEEAVKLKKKAEQNATHTLTKAQEEAESIIAQAKVKAQEESDDIMHSLKEEAERLLQESREKALSEGKLIADEIIREAKEKAAGILTDVIQHGINSIEYDFIRAVSSAKTVLENEKSRLLDDSEKEVIIVEKETGENKSVDGILSSINGAEAGQETEQETPIISAKS